MKKTLFFISMLILAGILFGLTSCQDINSQKRTTININLDLSKIVKTSRNENSTGTTPTPTEYLLKIYAYDATSYKENSEIEKLPLLTQSESKVDINGQVKANLEVEIGLKVIFVAKLYEGGKEKPIYAGNSEVFTVKATDNKVHINLDKVQSDISIDIGINPEGSVNYKVEHYKQNIADDKYSLVEDDTETKAGKPGEKTQAEEKTYTGFTVREFDQQTIISDGSSLVKIYYDRNLYTVTFNANGGNLTDNKTQSVKYEGKVTEPSAPTKSEYYFDGWYTSKDDGTTLDVGFSFETPITSDVVLYARWSEQSEIAYTVEHYQQNIENEEYTIVEGDTEYKTRKTAEQVQAIPRAYEGFFVKTVSQKTINQDGSTLVKIYYDRNIYTVTFIANGGSPLDISPQYIPYEGKASLPTAEPTRDGYIFLGWYTSLDEGKILSTKFDFTTAIRGDITLYARWETNFTSKFSFLNITSDDTGIIVTNTKYLEETSELDSYVFSEVNYPISTNKNYKISIDVRLDSEKEVTFNFLDFSHNNINLEQKVVVGTNWQTVEIETGSWQGKWNGQFLVYTGKIEKIYLKNLKIENLEDSTLPVAIYHSSIKNRSESGFTLEISKTEEWIAIGGQKAEYGNIYRVDFDIVATDDIKINCSGKISRNYAETGACHQINANVSSHFTLYIPHMGSDSQNEFDFIELGFWNIAPTTITVSDFSIRIATENDLAEIPSVYLGVSWSGPFYELSPCTNGEICKTFILESGQAICSESQGPYVITQETVPDNELVWDGNYIDSRTTIKGDDSTNYELILDEEGLRYCIKNISSNAITCKFWVNKLYQLVVEEYIE